GDEVCPVSHGASSSAVSGVGSVAGGQGGHMAAGRGRVQRLGGGAGVDGVLRTVVRVVPDRYVAEWTVAGTADGAAMRNPGVGDHVLLLRRGVTVVELDVAKDLDRGDVRGRARLLP